MRGRWVTSWATAFFLGASFCFCFSYAEELRNWSSKTGKFSVEANFVSATAKDVVLRSVDGKEITVPLDRLSDDDRKYVRERMKEGQPKKPLPKKSKEVSPEISRLRELANLFYSDLRTKERDEARKALTKEAQLIAEEGKSHLPMLPVPDEGMASVKLGKVVVSSNQAVVPVQVRVDGTPQSTSLHLRQDENDWRVFAISAKIAGDQITIDFETPLASLDNSELSLSDLIGKPIEITGVRLDGSPISSAALRGKVVLVDFWATWCGPCRAEIPNILENYKNYHNFGFEVLAVSTDRDLNELKNFVLQESPPWFVLADHHPQNTTSMSSKFKISGIPTFILIGKDGKVIDVNCRGAKLSQNLARIFGT